MVLNVNTPLECYFAVYSVEESVYTRAHTHTHTHTHTHLLVVVTKAFLASLILCPRFPRVECTVDRVSAVQELVPKLGHRAGQLTLCSCRGLYFVAGLQLPLCVCSVQTYRPARCERGQRRHSVQAPCLPSAHFLQSDGLIASIHLPQLSRLGNQGWMKREGRECRTVLWNRVWRVGQQHIPTPTPLICHMCSHNQSPPHSRAHAGSQACTQQGAHTHTHLSLIHI